MVNSVPSYMGHFRCLAGRCAHTCCAGWEIDIDEATRAKYARVAGRFGARLSAAIEEDHFKLTGADERCPMLNDVGLCDIIITLGEDALCQICRDHPRYVNEFEDGVETGLGLACEAAARLILGWNEPVRWSGGRFWRDDSDDAWLLDLRDALRAQLQDRRMPLEQRLRALCPDGTPPVDAAARFLATLETMDAAWTDCLARIAPGDDARAEDALWAEQFGVYLLDRHMPGALECGDADARIRFVALMTRLVCALHRRTGLPPEELCRLFSSEIEYSDENVGSILDWLSA